LDVPHDTEKCQRINIPFTHTYPRYRTEPWDARALVGVMYGDIYYIYASRPFHHRVTLTHNGGHVQQQGPAPSPRITRPPWHLQTIDIGISTSCLITHHRIASRAIDRLSTVKKGYWPPLIIYILLAKAGDSHCTNYAAGMKADHFIVARYPIRSDHKSLESPSAPVPTAIQRRNSSCHQAHHGPVTSSCPCTHSVTAHTACTATPHHTAHHTTTFMKQTDEAKSRCGPSH
jgi:hypothetical protein